MAGCQQHKEGQFSHTGDERQQIAAHETGFLNGEQHFCHAFPPRNAYHDARFFDLARKLQHRTGAGTGSKGHEFDGTDHHQKEQRALQPGEALGVGQRQVHRTEAHRRDEVGEERHIGDEGSQFAVALTGDGVTYQDAAGPGHDCRNQRDEQRTAECLPHRGAGQKTDCVTLGASFDEFGGEPVFQGEGGVVAGGLQQALHGKGHKRYDGKKRSENQHHDGDGHTGFSEFDKRHLTGFAGDGGKGFALARKPVVQRQDGD